MSEVKELLTNAERPAYPTNGRMHSEMVGLSKREMFAMAAMQGILANGNEDVPKHGPHDEWNYEEIAKSSVKAADELLKQLES